MKQKRREPSANTQFEMQIRAGDLNVTACLIWLLAALSHSRGYTFLTEAEMAKQLWTSLRQIQMSLKFIVETGYFHKVKPKGVHRPVQYHRVYLKEEDPDEFVDRIQADGRFDVATLMHWIACDQTAQTGTAEISFRGLWGCTDEALRQARRKMERLGYFSVVSDRDRGKPAIYTRGDKTASVEAAQAGGTTKRSDQDDDARRERERDRKFEEAGRESESDPRKREFLDAEFGTGKTIIGSRNRTRQVVNIPIKDDEDDW